MRPVILRRYSCAPRATAIGILLAFAAAGRADPILLNSGSHALEGINYGNPTNLAVGYIFSLVTSRAVNAFGLYDAANAPGTGFQGDGLLSNNNEVNLWRVSDQVLLATRTSIPQSGADVSGFIYQSVYTPMNGFTGI